VGLRRLSDILLLWVVRGKLLLLRSVIDGWYKHFLTYTLKSYPFSEDVWRTTQEEWHIYRMNAALKSLRQLLIILCLTKLTILMLYIGVAQL
jgi:hypothetical protein